MAQSKNPPVIRRMTALVFLVAALGFGIKAVALHPLYIQLASNVAHQNTFYTALLYYLIDWGVLDLAIFAVCYPVTAYAVWRTDLKTARPVISVFAAVTVCKFPLNYLVSCMTDTGFPDGDELLRDLLPILLMLVLELLQYAIVIALACLGRKRYDSRVNRAEIESQLKETTPPAPVFPFVKLISLQNPLQFTAFWTSVILFISREAGYHVYQITLYANFGSTDGWADMAITLFSDLAVSVLVYFAALLLLPRIHRGESPTE